MEGTGSEPASETHKPLTIAIVGFGTFGQFLGARYAKRGHRVIATSRRDYTDRAVELGCEFFPTNDQLLDHAPDVVLLCTSIISLHKVLSHFPLDRLSGTLVVDVLSVKLYPRQLLQKVLPRDADILCTHPMFGPVSGANEWHNLPFMYEKVRVSGERAHIADAYVAIFEAEGCKMVMMTAEEHDSDAASSQFLTHTTGRVLGDMHIHNTSINTSGFESLLGVADSSTKDSFDLFYGLYKYNPLAREELLGMERALKHVREQLEEMEKKDRADYESEQGAGGEVSVHQASEQVLRELAEQPECAAKKSRNDLFVSAIGMTFIRRLAQKAISKGTDGEPPVLDSNT